MATTPVNVGRQTILSAYRTFNFSDLTSGVAKALIYLKPGTRILRGGVDVTTAWTSGTSDVLTVGDSEGSSPAGNRYKTSFSIAATGLTALVAPVADGVIDTAEAVTVTWTGVGDAPTAGEATLYIEYTEAPRVTEFHTYRG